MSKRKKNKLKNEVFEDCVSANECTGLLQKISIDKGEVAKFHRQYTGEDEIDKEE